MATRPLQASLPLGTARAMSVAAGPPDKAEADPVMAKAGRLLSRRAHSVRELRDKLWGAGIPEEDIEHAIDRLLELRLLDDAAFAQAWVDERSRTKGLPAAALLDELRTKGVDPEVAQAAVDAAGLDEEAQARQLATNYIRKVVGKPVMVQAQRIQAMLLRKGFSLEAAIAGTKAVLPPEGWD